MASLIHAESSQVWAQEHAHAPSPGSAVLESKSKTLPLPASPSSSAGRTQANHAVREWTVIRPHIDFLNEVAARHFPSLFFLEKSIVKDGDNRGESSAQSTNHTRSASDPNLFIPASPTAASSFTSEENTASGEVRISPRTQAISTIVERLISFCNREDRKTKKEIFRVIRCHNCSQSSTGGTKIGIRIALPPHQVVWMNNVHKACKHPTVDKTMRILLEWYIAVMRTNPDMEFVVFGEGTEARRGLEDEIDTGGFAMGLSASHENGLHLRGRKPKGEAEKVLRAQFENPTVTTNTFATPTTTSNEHVYMPGPELKVILHNLGKGC